MIIALPKTIIQKAKGVACRLSNTNYRSKDHYGHCEGRRLLGVRNLQVAIVVGGEISSGEPLGKGAVALIAHLQIILGNFF
ncbi:hypothetical protein F511_00105 [Dorcoceras hygrometricum]|nr:hypothetical protein F511_00105 [Dorcoceras hygrometricum]